MELVLRKRVAAKEAISSVLMGVPAAFTPKKGLEKPVTIS